MEILSSAEMALADKAAIRSGIPGPVLMSMQASKSPRQRFA
jgi:hypothetical protein